MKDYSILPRTLFCAFAVAANFTANAGRPFEAEATAEDGSGLERTISASEFEKLVEDVVRADGKLSDFENRESFFAVNFAGVKEAFTLRWSREEPEPRPDPPVVQKPPPDPPPSKGGGKGPRSSSAVRFPARHNRGGASEPHGPLTEAVLEMRSTGFRKTFTGKNREEIEEQILEFLEGDGKDEFEKLLQELNKESKIAPLDGNPNAATARAAAATYSEFGQISEENAQGNADGVSIGAEVGRFAAGEFEGDAYALPLAYTKKVNTKVSVVITVPLSYIEIEGAEIYNVNVGVSVPIRFRQSSPAVRDLPSDGKEVKATVDSSPTERWTWQVTPTVGAIDSHSEQFDTGALMTQASLTNLVAYTFDRFTVSMGNHVSWLEGQGAGRHDDLTTVDVSQVLLKNGLQVRVPLGDRWSVSAYGIYTRFMQDAGVTDYVTIGGDIGYRPVATSQAFLRLGIYSDLGSDYETATVRLGSSWKF